MKGNVRKRGKKWYYRFDVADKDGKRRQHERVGGDSYKEAMHRLRVALELYENTGAVTNTDKISTHDYFEFWYDNYVKTNLSKNTQLNYRHVLDKYVQPTLGIYQLSKVTPELIQKTINKIADSTEYKPDHTQLHGHTVEIILMVIKEGFRQAVHPWHILTQSPAEYVRQPKYNHPKTTREDLKIITLQQFNQLLEQFPLGHPFHLPLLISFYTGMRRGEVAGLEWDNVSLPDAEINVTQQMKQYSKTDVRLGKLKTAASYRTIAIGDQLIHALKVQRRLQNENRLRYGKNYHESNFVCTKENGKPVTPNSIKYYASTVTKELGFPFNFHSLRHTHATMLLEAGASAKEVQVRLGHNKIATTLDTYVHLSNKKKHQTANLFDQIAKM